MGIPPTLPGLALTLVTMMGVWKSLPPVIRKPQGAGPMTFTVSAIPEEEDGEVEADPSPPKDSMGGGERQKGGEEMTGPGAASQGPGVGGNDQLPPPSCTSPHPGKP